MLDAKLVRFYQGGEAIDVSIAEIKARGLNHWRDWNCAIGSSQLSISADGEVFGSVCRAGGSLGNIFSGFANTRVTIRCPNSSCYCAADIRIVKYRNEEISFSQFRAAVEVDTLNEIEAVVGNDHLLENDYFQVNWNIGRRCNFDCSYCPADVHDAQSSHLTAEQLELGFQNLLSEVPARKRLRIVFTGGEPTMNPTLIEFARKLHGAGVEVFLNTNGSGKPEELVEWSKISSIFWSVHFEFYNQANFLRRLNAVLGQAEKKIQLKLMLHPEYFEVGRKLAAELSKIENANLSYRIEPIVDKNEEFQLNYYTSEQLDFIAQNS